MKATNYFTRTILTYLEQRAETDALFAQSFANPDKTIGDCIQYILNTVQKSGCNGFEDAEIYSLATHFYQEENIEIGNPINCNIIVNHTIILTEEEKEEARKEAIQKAQDEAYNRVMQPKKKVNTKQSEVSNQLSLF